MEKQNRQNSEVLTAAEALGETGHPVLFEKKVPRQLISKILYSNL